LSFVPQAYLPLLYAGARVFAFPSHYEGFGLPVLEAMASGVPVLTSNVSSLPEVVGTAGMMIAPSDVVAMTAELEALLCDEQLRVRMAEYGLARARAFTWSRCVDATVRVYKSL
jgi:alpha-1,3-rhamnosyl/mannosyltransferase